MAHLIGTGDSIIKRIEKCEGRQVRFSKSAATVERVKLEKPARFSDEGVSREERLKQKTHNFGNPLQPQAGWFDCM
jgi:hypothetical protein